MEIRLAKLEDKKEILKLLDELIQEAKMQGVVPPKNQGDKKAKRELLDEVIKRGDVYYFAAEENGRLVGLAEVFIMPIVRRGYRQAVIESLIVTKDMRNKGIGSSLIQSIKAFCIKRNIKILKLTSNVKNTNAHRFYERHGGKFNEKLYRFEL